MFEKFQKLDLIFVEWLKITFCFTFQIWICYLELLAQQKVQILSEAGAAVIAAPRH